MSNEWMFDGAIVACVRLGDKQGSRFKTVHVSAKLNVTQIGARRKVNVFVLNEIGTGLGGDTPMLVFHDGRVCWRVPVILALLPKGRLGQVGRIDVDAQTGEILADNQLMQDIADHAEKLAAGSPS